MAKTATSLVTMPSRGVDPAATMLTPDDSRLLAAHLAWMRLRGLATITVYHRQRAVTRLAEHLGGPLLAATEKDLDLWQRSISHQAPRSRLSFLSNVASFYAWAVEWEYMPAPAPTRILVRPKRPRGLPHPIGEDDLTMAITCAPERVRAMLVLAAYAGMRVGEIARLEREDVRDSDDPPFLVVNGKGGKQRIVPMSQLVTDELHLHGLQRRGPVFPRMDGQRGPCEAWTISHLCAEYLHGLGITESAHGLRHRFGTRVYAVTRDLRLCQELMGHESPVTTAGYAAYSSRGAMDAVRALAGEPAGDKDPTKC